MSQTRTGHRPQDWQDLGPSNGTAGHSLSFRAEPQYRETLPREPRPVKGPDPRCALIGRCRHQEHVAMRVEEVRRLYTTTDLTLGQIGQLMGGRDHSTVSYWLREYEDKVA